MLYRFYKGPTRITIEASTKREAQERFEEACKDFSHQLRGKKQPHFRRVGNPRYTYRRSHEISPLNAWDDGYALGISGATQLSDLMASYESKRLRQQAAFGYHQGVQDRAKTHRLSKGSAQ